MKIKTNILNTINCSQEELFWLLTKNDYSYQCFEPIDELIQEEFFPLIVLKDKQVTAIIHDRDSCEKYLRNHPRAADRFILIDDLPKHLKLNYASCKLLRKTPKKAQRIFVSIVSYRDADLINTLHDLFEKASEPNEIRVYCLAQVHSDDEFNIDPSHEIFDKYSIDYASISCEKSKGVCWARAYIQDQIKNESYFLQIDSHMRFAPGWDSCLIDLIEQAPVKKAVISCYPPHFVPGKEDEKFSALFYTAPKNFSFNSSLIMHGVAFDPKKEANSYKEHGWISAGYMFTRSSFNSEVKLDPFLYFQGEENDLSLKAFERGWTSYAPSECVVWHYYYKLDENKRIRHWDEKNKWAELSEISDARIGVKLHLKEYDKSRPELVNLDGHYIENKTVLRDFEKLLGVDYQTKTIKNVQ